MDFWQRGEASIIDILQISLLSLRVAGVGILFALPIAFCLAYILARGKFVGKALLSALIMLPLVMPPVVTGLMLLNVFGPLGPIGQWLGQFGIVLGFRWTGAALAAGLVALPLIVRPMRMALENVDPRLHEALKVAGHNRWRRLIILDLPLAMPGIIAGTMLGFAKAMGEFGATITFVANIPGETQTLSLAIFSALQSPGGEQLVWTLVAISMGISVVGVVVSEVLVERLSARQNSGRVKHA